jgi:hypothetical protein
MTLQSRRQGFARHEQDATGKDGTGVDVDILGGQIVESARVFSPLVQQIDGQLHDIRLEPPSHQGGAIVQRGTETNPSEKPPILEGASPLPQGPAFGSGQITGLANQQGVTARQTQALQRAAGAGLDPVQTVVE